MTEPKRDIQMVIITGLSGAGKTQTVQCLEDLGFFCIDNLPPTLIPKFAELCAQSEGKINKVALVIDIRGGKFFDTLFDALENLKTQGFSYEILFLEASDEVLVRRFKESRRRHPLSPLGRILEGITAERHRLEELRGRANKIIDTSDLTVQELKDRIIDLFATETGKFMVTLMSFGYKYGIPLDADLVTDVRFLPNPYYVPHLKPLTGHDPQIRDYVLNNPVTRHFLRRYGGLLKFLLPHYITEGKTHLVVAIGCTGGQHRSVVLVNEIAQLLQKYGYEVIVKHRDIARSVPGEGRL